MFEKGEYVVYGSKGVCKIQDISHVDIPGVDRNRLFYIMHPVQNSEQTVYLPIDSNKVMIRKVMTPEEAKRLIQDIPSIEVLEVPNEKQREASYKAALHECSGRSWISILKTLHQRKDERLAAGKKADLIMIDLQQPNMQPENNIVKNLVYSGSKQNVKLTMVNGKILYEDQKFSIGFEPADIYKEANRIIRSMEG